MIKVRATVTKIIVGIIIGSLITAYVKSGSYEAEPLDRTALSKKIARRHKSSVKRFLRWIDSCFLFFVPTEVGIFSYLQLRPFLACFSAALIYPIFFFCASWIAGGNPKVGNLELFSQNSNMFTRYIQFALMLLSITFWTWFLFAPKMQRFTETVCSSTIGALLGYLTSFNLEIGGVAAVVSAAFGPLIYFLAKREIIAPLFYLIPFAIGTMITTSQSTSSISGYFIFMAVLPVANATFDWVSLGISRYFFYQLSLTRKIGHLLAITLLEIVISLFMIYVTALTTMEMINWLQNHTGSSAIDWVNYSIENSLAIRLMLFTSFIPTLIHIIIASYSLSFAILLGFPHPIMNDNNANSEPSRSIQVAQAGFSLACLVLALWSLYQVFAASGSEAFGELCRRIFNL